MCRVVQCLLEVINVIFIVSGISLVVTGAVFSYEAMAIPGPLGPAAIGAIIVGIVMVIMGAFGYKAARDRKIEGKEFKGKCELMVYAAVVFVMFSALFVVSVVLFVWLGDGIPIPETGAKDVDSLTLSGVEAAQKPVTNLVGCVYDSCCFNTIEDAEATAKVSNMTANATNSTESLWADCFIDEDGIPDHKNGKNIKNENGTVTEDAIEKISNSNKYCEMFKGIRCDQGVDAYRKDAGTKIYNKLAPFAYAIVALAGLLLLGWVFAVAEIFWCCGPSDLDENDTKVAPENYDDY